MSEDRALNSKVGMRKAEGKKEDRALNSEVGMRPPADRGIRLRPGGK